jgi:hypothetical protein
VSRTSHPGDAWACREAGRRRIASPLRIGFTVWSGPGILVPEARSRLSVGGGTSGFARLGVSPEGIRLPGTRAGHGVADAGPKPVPAD